MGRPTDVAVIHSRASVAVAAAEAVLTRCTTLAAQLDAAQQAPQREDATYLEAYYAERRRLLAF